MPRRAAFCALLVSLAVTVAGCPPSPRGTPKQSLEKCGSLEPLVVEWDPAARGRIEAARAKGLIAVRYQDCVLEILDCHATGNYSYVSLTAKAERIVMKDRDSLYLNVPIGAASLEGKLTSKGELDADLTIAGRYEFERATVTRSELQGDCERATHVVSGITVGAFLFSAGGSSAVSGGGSAFGAGVGGSSASSRELLTRDGDGTTCAAAKPGDGGPPAGCGAIVRLELATIGLTAQDQCSRAGVRLIGCGVPFWPEWSTVCPTVPAFASCAKAAGDDCTSLSMCVHKMPGAACAPAGTRTCKQTADCYVGCTSNVGKAADECNCACTAAMSPDRALALMKHNGCWLARCKNSNDPDCFMKNCAADAQDCWAD